MSENKIENQLEFVKERETLLLFIWRKRKLILLITGIAAVASIVVSMLLTPLFKSTAIIFPAATTTVSFSEQRNAKTSSMDFGEEEQAEQLLQILQSSRIRTRIVNQFNLMEHYEIPADDKNKNFKLIKEWENHITYARTRYGSIQIDVLDYDRELSAQIANKIVELIDTVKNEMIKERTIPAFEINQRKKNMLESKNNELLEKLDSLSKIGVVSIEGRANLFAAYIEAKNPVDREFFKEKIDVNLKNGAIFDGLEMARNENIQKLSRFEDAYEQAESDANTIFSHKFIVEPAIVADKKDKPKRLIIVLLGTIGTFFFVIFFLLIRDRIAELRKVA